MTRKVVVLPQPDGPRRVTKLPFGMSRSRLGRARWLPYALGDVSEGDFRHRHSLVRKPFRSGYRLVSAIQKSLIFAMLSLTNSGDAVSFLALGHISL